ncbi:50S ribosomal protein L21 [Parvularcula sp. LCG005]|uniref:50S ribosomal protein L21 n=1 Tax=Parvularcula sp. LCG005 TaxID=3078805 RepID=UPI002943D301|nr:50S ribosomal protein L21 [Parvularcula sp. LCG005]WOI53008.1 50S ribosomal protein L21 [Parvularcula sp. LCG005]
MYAVVKTGGKQFRVAANDVIKVEKLSGDAGDIVTLGEVLMLGGDSPVVGAPLVDGASVSAEILEQARDSKITVFKKRRRQNYRRKKGHRQMMTVLRIQEILTGGAKPSGKAAAKPAAKKAAPAADVKDDVSLIGGVGPKLKEKLAGVGIESLKPIAEMSDDTKAKLDEIGLLNRATTEEWAEQAQELLAGKPPRAKTDQAAAKKDD